MSRLLVEIVKPQRLGESIKTVIYCETIKLSPDTGEHSTGSRAVVHINGIVAAEGLFEKMREMYNTIFNYMEITENNKRNARNVSKIKIENNKLVILNGVRNLNE
jgi:hypothetical protein